MKALVAVPILSMGLSMSSVTWATPLLYNSGQAYSKGTQVEYNGHIYEAKWWAGAEKIPGAAVEHEWETPWDQVDGVATDSTTTTKPQVGSVATDSTTTTKPQVGSVATDSTTTTMPDAPQEAINIEVSYGETWDATNMTSSVQFHLSEDLSNMTLLFPQGTISAINNPWGVDIERSQSGGMDRVVFRKKPDITYEVTTFGFNLVLGAGKKFETIQVNECLSNNIQCLVTFKQNISPGASGSTDDAQQAVAVDPFPKRVPDDSGNLVNVTGWTIKGTTYKTYQRPTYTTSSGSTKDYMVGGYFTDWGIYKGFTPTRLPINNINFIQLAFAAVCGPGDANNWYGNESATVEAKPKIKELCQNKPVGTMIILDHWAHYGKKDMNLPEWIKPYGELAYHVENYERDLNFLGFGTPDDYPIHNVGGVELYGENKLNYAYGIQSDLRSYNQVLNRSGRKFNMFLSIGGWTLSDPFPAIADNPTYRKNFISSITGYLSKNKHINGIDIDWEFIGVDGAKPGIMGTRDSNNYTKLMAELRSNLTKLTQSTGVTYHLSAAIGTAPRHLDKIHWDAVMIDGTHYQGIKDILDHVFLMSYDYYGPWAGQVGHQAALYTNGETIGYSADAAVRYLKNAGVSSRKIILGVAGYGRIWKNVKESELNRNGKYTFPNMSTGHSPGNVGTTAGIVLWHHLKRVAYQDDGTLKDNYRWIQDTTAKAEFLLYEEPESTVNFVASLDTPYSIKEKAKYVKEQNLGGIFYWSLDNENGDLLNAIHEGLGSIRKSNDLKPSFRENSLILYRVKEANYCSNSNIKQRYALQRISDVIGNVFTFGGKGIVDSIKSLLSLPAALAHNTDIADLTDKQWEEYVQLLKTVDQYGNAVADLTIEEARRQAQNAGATLGYTTVDILFSPPTLIGIGLTAAGQDYIMDAIISPHGGDYCGRITRDSLDSWRQMRKDFPALNYNY